MWVRIKDWFKHNWVTVVLVAVIGFIADKMRGLYKALRDAKAENEAHRRLQEQRQQAEAAKEAVKAKHEQTVRDVLERTKKIDDDAKVREEQLSAESSTGSLADRVNKRIDEMRKLQR